MAVNLSPVGGVAAQFFDNSGNVLTGGKLYTYAAGTTTPATTYTNSAGNVAWSNPIVLDASGRVSGSGEIWLSDTVVYKFVLKDSNDVLIATYDNVTGINSNFVAFTSEEETQTATQGQTLFTLTQIEYQPATNNLLVFVNGSKQIVGDNYVETSSTSVTFIDGLNVGDVVDFTTATPISGTVTDASLVTYTPPYVNSVSTNVEAKLAQTISIEDFGASAGASPSTNTTAIQNALDACPEGGCVYIPNGVFEIDDELIIDKAITIQGAGPGKWIDSLGGSIIKQTDDTKNAFTLRASVAQYAFGQYGLNNVNFQDLAIEGPSDSTYAVNGIGCDTTVNSGDYHIRECTFTNLQVRFFQVGIQLIGICYLNDFYGGVVSQCDTGFSLLKGAASDRGGQTRFFGTTFVLNTDACVSWNTDTTSGDLSMFGCTLGDSAYGIVANEESTLMISGCSFENNTKTGSLGAGIYIEILESTPSSDAAKNIIGNKFTANDCSIWVNKIATANSGNDWSWPMLIDGNTLLDAEALRITIPAGQQKLSAQNFVFGSSNAGTTQGFITPSQISSNFAGRNMLQQTIARRTTFGPSVAGSLKLPNGMVVTSARMYLTANASSFTGLFGGDADNNYRYYSGIDGTTAPLNTWTTWTPPVPQFIVNSELKQLVTLSGTAGMQGATGIFEIEGYIP